MQNIIKHANIDETQSINFVAKAEPKTYFLYITANGFFRLYCSKTKNKTIQNNNDIIWSKIEGAQIHKWNFLLTRCDSNYIYNSFRSTWTSLKKNVGLWQARYCKYTNQFLKSLCSKFGNISSFDKHCCFIILKYFRFSRFKSPFYTLVLWLSKTTDNRVFTAYT